MAGNSARTAIARSGPSAPLTWLLACEMIPEAAKVLDYGCGKGADVDHLRDLGVQAAGWDPHHCDNVAALRPRYDIVLSTYVANVLSWDERAVFYAAISGLLTLEGVAYVSVRRDVDKVPGGGGYFTSTGTFQAWVDVEHDLTDGLSADALPTDLEAECIREVSGYAIYKLTRRTA